MVVREGSSRRRGTSLLEIGFCVLLVAIAIIPIVRSQMATTAATRVTREEAVAAAVIAMCIERYRDESPSWLAVTNLNDHAAADPLLSPHEASTTTTSPALLPPAEATRVFSAQAAAQFHRDIVFDVQGASEGGEVSHGLLKVKVTWTHRQDGASRDRAVEASVLVHERHPRGKT